MGPPLLLQVELRSPRPSIVFLGSRRSRPTSGKLAPVSPGVRRVLIARGRRPRGARALHWATFHCPSRTTTRSCCSWAAPCCTASSPPHSGTSRTTAPSTPTCSLRCSPCCRTTRPSASTRSSCAVLLVWLVALLARRLAGPQAALARSPRRRLGHALHGAHDGHRAAAELPDAACDRLPAARRARRAGAERGRDASDRGLRRASASCSSPASPAGSRSGTRRSRFRRFVGMAAGLALAGLRPRLRSAATFSAGVRPGRWSAARGAAHRRERTRVETAASAVTALRPQWLWAQGLADLGHALAGLVGFQVPLVVDGRERATLPPLAVALLAAALLATVLAACRRGASARSWAGRRRSPGAFWLSRRTGPDELRYLYGIHAPLAALVGAGLAALWTARRACGAAAGLALALGPGASATATLARAWSEPGSRRAGLGGAVARRADRRPPGQRACAAPTRACSSPAASRSSRGAP